MERRDFLKVVTSVSVSQTLLLTLKTSAMDRRLIIDGERVVLKPGGGKGRSTAPSEKITLSNNRANLIIDVESRPGRHALLLYKLANAAGQERIFIHKDAAIPRAGHLTFAVDMACCLDADYPFMIVTSAQATYDAGNLGTDWFIVRIAGARPEDSVFPPSLQTDPTGEHQKVIRYAVSPAIHKRVFAALDTNRPD